MAAPLAAVAGKIAQRILIDLINDPEKAVKGISLVVLVPILIIVLIFILPVILIVSIPTLLISGGSSIAPDVLTKQLATIAIYSSAPETISQQNIEWINQQKLDYSWCDDIVVQSSVDISWQQLMSIDSVSLNQDFSNVNANNVIALANKFISRNVRSENYTVQETYVFTYADAEENIHTGVGTATVTKSRAIIEISTKPFNTVLNEIGLSTSDREIANNIYRTLITSQNPGGNSGTVSGNVLNWRPQIEAAALRYYVDPALIAAIIHQESGGNPMVMSPVGAIGLMQLMPGTAHDLGVNPFDPVSNIDGGTHYIASLLTRFSLQEALASYNAGPGNVLNGRWVSFPETVNYVSRVQQLYLSYKQVFTGM